MIRKSFFGRIRSRIRACMQRTCEVQNAHQSSHVHATFFLVPSFFFRDAYTKTYYLTYLPTSSFLPQHHSLENIGGTIHKHIHHNKPLLATHSITFFSPNSNLLSSCAVHTCNKGTLQRAADTTQSSTAHITNSQPEIRLLHANIAQELPWSNSFSLSTRGL